MSLVVRTSVAVLVAIVLSACGATHPGAAVVVDGESISMGALDARAEAICLVQVAKGQEGSYSNADLRRSAAAMLALQGIATSIVEEDSLTVDPAIAALPEETIAQVKAVFEDNSDAIIEYFREQQTLYAQLIAIGADTSGVVATADNLDALAQAGQVAVEEQFEDRGVKFAPRLGLADDGSSVVGFGSISVAPADLAADTTPASHLSSCSS